jgi:MFS family permease
MKGTLFKLFPDFTKLFIARVISAIGDKFFTLSLMWWVISLPNGKFGLSLAMAATFLPVVIFSPIMGTMADRHNKKYLMLLADFLRALFLSVILILLIYEKLSLTYLLIFVFFIYTFSPLFETSVSSSLLMITSENHLSAATAIDSSSIGISNVIGAMLGSILIAIIGFKGAVTFNMLTYLLSFSFVLLIRKK